MGCATFDGREYLTTTPGIFVNHSTPMQGEAAAVTHTRPIVSAPLRAAVPYMEAFEASLALARKLEADESAEFQQDADLA